VEPRLVHLKKRKEFLRVAAAAKKFVTPSLVLQARARDEAEAGAPYPFRVGFTVSRKVGNAVIRNRVRRRLKAAAEQVLPEHAPGNNDYVIIGRRAALNRPYASLVDNLIKALDSFSAERSEKKSAPGAKQSKHSSTKIVP